MANMYIPIWKVHICQITSHWEWLGLSQFIAHLRLLGVLEVDAGLSEPPGQAKSEQIGVVPRFVIWYDPNIILSNLWGSYHKELPPHPQRWSQNRPRTSNTLLNPSASPSPLPSDTSEPGLELGWTKSHEDATESDNSGLTLISPWFLMKLGR